ncbi:MAG: VOC family protein [Bacteroidota bacterium]|nr:VOC family protein [Bacteroidota bacterium]
MTRSISKMQNKPVINHIAVHVVNLETSTHFYNNIIGLDIIPEPFHDGRHTWFSINEQASASLHIIQGAAAISDHDKDSHLCFSVPSLETFIDNLDKNNVAFENWEGQANSITVRPDGVKQIFFKDPDGYWLEINDAK